MPKSLQLQTSDIKLLVDLGETGLLNTEQIHARHFAGRTRRRSQQRLRQLREQNFVRCVGVTVWSERNGGGRVPTMHFLTERGAEVVERITGCRPKRFWRCDPKPETLLHRLGIVQTRLALDDGCQLVGLRAPEWIMEQDRRDDVQRDTPPSQRRVLYHEFTAAGKKFTCQPDAACLLQIPRNLDRLDTDTTPLVAYFEIDRSTERTAQVAAKCAGYATAIEERMYRRYWQHAGAAAVRVFWVCLSPERIESLTAKLREQPVAQLFRFAVASDLRAETAFTAPIWRTIDGERREILRLPACGNTPRIMEVGHPAPHLPPHVGP
jgi:hypothetical protein